MKADLPARGFFVCNPVLFALRFSNDAVTWADPERWKPPEEVGDPQGLEQGRALNREGPLTLRCP